MKTSNARISASRYLILGFAIIALAILPLRSMGRATSTSVNIVNNSSREVRHAYLSHVGADDWTGDQLNGSIGPGQSTNLGNIACDQQQVRVIAEDQDGCFLYNVVNCGDSATWTITDNTARDCDG